MKLNIYEKRKIVKTYEVQEYDLLFGTIEDVAAVVDFDKLETGSDAEIIKMVGKLVMSSMDLVKDLLKDIFEGLTDEEIRHTRTSEIAAVMIDVVIYTAQRIGRTFGGGTGKN